MPTRFSATPACLDLDSEIFFPLAESEDDEGPTRDELRALRVCWGCPIVGECLSDRLDWEIATKNDPWGVCGATTGAQRRALIRNREAVAA